MDCLAEQLGDEGNISFEEIKNKFRPCMIDKLETIEDFTVGDMSAVDMIILILAVIVIMLFIRKVFFR